MKASAVAGCCEYALTARLAPPSELDPGPSGPGSAVTPNLPATLLPGPGVAGVAVDVGPVVQEQQLARLERLPRCLLVPAERGLRDPALAEPADQEAQRAAGLRASSRVTGVPSGGQDATRPRTGRPRRS